MPIDLSDKLVIGVSSRALYDLEEENLIFEKEGIQGFREHQLQNENKILEPGSAFYLVKKLLGLNELTRDPIVEVIIMSRNSPETGIRILNSLEEHDLSISRMALTGGEPLSPYIEAFNVDLFLSKDSNDVQNIIDSGVSAAAVLLNPPKHFDEKDMRVKIAFDADAVIFSDESEYRNKTEGLEAFHKYESKHKDKPLEKGPFGNFLIKLSKIQKELPDSIELTPVRIAIVTARNAPSHLRVIKTLRNWDVYVDEIYFLGGIPKDKVLKAFGAHIFFDDQDTHLLKSSKYVPSAKVPYLSNSPMKTLDGAKIVEKKKPNFAPKKE